MLPFTLPDLRFWRKAPIFTDAEEKLYGNVTSATNGHSATVLASVDLFVEKAQHHITSRGTLYLGSGLFCILTLALVLTLGYLHLLDNPISRYAKELAEVNKSAPVFDVTSYFTWQTTFLLVTRGFATTAIFSSAIYVLTVLARAFFHEANALFALRDALRFGRLFFYVKFSGLGSEEFAKARDEITIEHLEHAFVRSRQFTSAFQFLSGRIASHKNLQDEVVLKIFEKVVDKAWDQVPTSGRPPTGGQG
jgi:hypothetical protein